MLAKPVSMLLLDEVGDPIDGITTTLIYKDKSGTDRVPPTVVNTAGGRYSFQPSDDDATVGTIWLMSAPGTSTPYLFGSISTIDKPFIAVFIQDGSGGLAPTGTPTWRFYLDSGSVPIVTQPSIISVAGTYLWCATPADADLVNGVQWCIDTGGGYPSFYSGIEKAGVVTYTAPKASTVFVSNENRIVKLKVRSNG